MLSKAEKREVTKKGNLKIFPIFLFQTQTGQFSKFNLLFGFISLGNKTVNWHENCFEYSPDWALPGPENIA